jgi:hypothetical protein
MKYNEMWQVLEIFIEDFGGEKLRKETTGKN